MTSFTPLIFLIKRIMRTWSLFILTLLAFFGVFRAIHTLPVFAKAGVSQEDFYAINGERYKYTKGKIYILKNGSWHFIHKAYKAEYEQVEIQWVEGRPVIINQKQKDQRSFVPLAIEMHDGFERIKHFSDLFQRPNGWSKFALQSPLAKTPKDYMKLGKAIMQGDKGFRDNKIEIEHDIVRSGQQALRFYAVAPSPDMVTSKSQITKQDMYFVQGDDLWFSAWYFLKKGTPSTLVDFENSLLFESGGPRIFLRKQKYLTMELKFADKPQYVQNEVVVPRNQWFELKVHMKLSSKEEEGLIRIWQDDRLVLSSPARTLPTYDSTLNSLQIGITATSMETDLVMDDLYIGKKLPK